MVVAVFRIWRLRWLSVTLCVMLCVTHKVYAKESINVLVSIRPLALIAADIAPQSVQIKTLVPVWADPHSFQLRVSDAKALNDADLVVWLGEELERFLSKPLSNVSTARVIALAELSGLHWPGEASTYVSRPHKTHDTHGDHDHSSLDPHLWLDIENAVVIAHAMANALAQLLPEQAALIADNVKHFEQKMQVQYLRSMALLAPYTSVGFGVSHDAFTHFVHRFRLNQLAAVSSLPDERLSAKKMMQLQRAFKPAACMVVETDSRANIKLARTLQVPMVVADTLAADVSINHFGDLIQHLTDAFVQCLSQKVH